MAESFKPDAQSPFGFELESFYEAKKRRGQEKAGVFANSQSGFHSLGAAMGALASMGVNRLKGRIDPALKMAQSNDEAMKVYNDTLMQNLQGGTEEKPIDYDKAERKALAAAVVSFRMNGNEEAASRTLQQLISRQKEAELFGLNKAKLAAAAKPNSEYERQDSVRKELDAKLADDIKSFTSLDNLESALAQGTAQSDVAAIFAYMKVLDPASTVREGEFATVAATKESIFNQLKDGTATLNTRVVEQFLNKLSGERFTDRQRVEMANAARAAIKERGARVQAEIVDNIALANSRGWAPDSIISGSTKNVYERLGQSWNISEVDKGLVDQGYSVAQILRKRESPDEPLGVPENAPKARMSDAPGNNYVAPKVKGNDPTIDAVIDPMLDTIF